MEFQVGDSVSFVRTNGKISAGKISEIDLEQENPYHILFLDNEGRESGNLFEQNIFIRIKLGVSILHIYIWDNISSKITTITPLGRGCIDKI